MSEKMPCRHCHEPEDDHHPFEAAVMPRGCVCDYRDWGCEIEEIPAPCGEYLPNEDPDLGYGRNCVTCEHGQECHR